MRGDVRCAEREREGTRREGRAGVSWFRRPLAYDSANPRYIHAERGVCHWMPLISPE